MAQQEPRRPKIVTGPVDNVDSAAIVVGGTVRGGIGHIGHADHYVEGDFTGSITIGTDGRVTFDDGEDGD